ncbi:MAG: type II 3-dehydroquinate dehydratase [Xanthomonadales bacterium]|nr:type II 3-dehydroquinate dehydratase [Xanthomonadales bacterium]
MAHILLLNGPNLNLLGQREPEHYGQRSLSELVKQMQEFAENCGHQLGHLQANAEHLLLEAIHQAGRDGVDYIIFNPAAFTHTSVALRDALCAVDIPFVEVHLSNIQAREDFRKQSYFSDIAMGTITGFAGDSYLLALQAVINRMEVNE